MPPEIEGLGVYELAEIDVSSCHNLKRLPVPMLCGAPKTETLRLGPATSNIHESQTQIRKHPPQTRRFVSRVWAHCHLAEAVVSQARGGASTRTDIPRVSPKLGMTSLVSLVLADCLKLPFPPAEMTTRGGRAAMRFLR